MSMIADDETRGPCFYCGEAVDLNSEETLAWVSIGKHFALPAHKACDDRHTEENGPSDSILERHFV